MFVFFVILFFSSMVMALKFFSHKILVLLLLELCFLSLLVLNLIFSFSSKNFNSFLCSLVLMTFMVLDSVFGLCLLVFSSRNSSIYSSFVLD